MATSRGSDRYRRLWELRHRGIPLGVNTETDRRVYLLPQALFRHLHVLGPPGVGKSCMLVHLAGCLLDLGAAVAIFHCKGDLARQARDWAVSHGHAQRLVVFDPADPERVVGYNPLRANGLPVATHAKAVREGIRAAWGQSSFDATAQLGRLLLLSLYVARELELTLIEATHLLRPRSELRARLLPQVRDPEVHGLLEYFDGLRDTRQEELAASSLARLESFILDPLLRRIFAQDQALDIGQVIRDRKLLIVTLEINNPLRIDDVRLLGRLLINDIVGNAFQRGTSPGPPIFLILDEVETWLTDDLAQAVDLGRELRLGIIAAHQYLGQLRRPGDETDRLLGSVLNSVRNRMVFGGISSTELAPLLDDLVADRMDPRLVKDEITGLELEPVEQVRVIQTRTETWNQGQGESVNHTRAVGNTLARTRMRSTTHARGSGTADGTTSSTTTVDGTGLFIPDHPDAIAAHSFVQTEGSVSGATSITTYQESEAETEGSSEGEAETWQRSQGEQSSNHRGEGGSIATAEVPFQHIVKRLKVIARTFAPLDEQRFEWTRTLREQADRHFFLKTGVRPGVFVRAINVSTPLASRAALERARAAMYALPYYATRETVDAEEHRRRERLLGPAVVASKPQLIRQRHKRHEF